MTPMGLPVRRQWCATRVSHSCKGGPELRQHRKRMTSHQDENELEERPLQFNWELLAQSLPADTLAALRDHANARQESTAEDLEEESATAEDTEDTANEESILVKESIDHRKYGVNVPNSVFKLHSYWEDRFAEEESFEWLVGWQQVSRQLEKYIKKTDRILVVGCGNCPFSEGLYDAGFENLVNIDFSEKVIEKMRSLHSTARPNMTWEVMDMTKMTFPSDSFDVVLDKAAMDALVVDEGDVWDPIQSVIDSVDQMCLSVDKVLHREHGIHLQISFAQPHFRTKYLMGYRAEHNTEVAPTQTHSGFAKRYNWNLAHEVVDTEAGCLSTFLYVMTRP